MNTSSSIAPDDRDCLHPDRPARYRPGPDRRLAGRLRTPAAGLQGDHRPHWGVGEITGSTTIAELGNARRFAQPPGRGALHRPGRLGALLGRQPGPGKLVKQGPGLLRRALVEAVHIHARFDANHHDYYPTVKARIDGNRAARKLIREIRHTLTGLGDAAIAPPDDMPVDLPVACPVPAAA